MAGQGTARALTMLEIRMTLDSINRWLEAIQSGHHILQHELERQFKSRPNHRQILYELAQQQLITPVVFRHLLALADDTGSIHRFSPVASMVPHRPDGVQSTAAAASVTAKIHSQGVASSRSTTTTPPPPAAVQAPTTPASTPAAATRSVSISEVDHGAANVVPCVDVPLTTKSSATCSTYVLIGTPEGYVADAVPLVSGPQHVVAKNKEDDPHELIIDVGGVSLFLEIFVEPAKVVSSEPLKELDADHVLTHVGGSSLFLELVVESTVDRVCDEEFVDNMLTDISGSSLFLELIPGTNQELVDKEKLSNHKVVLLDSTSLWEIEKVDMFSTEAGHISSCLCQQLNKMLKVNYLLGPADSEIILAPHSNSALTNDIYEDDPVQTLECELQNLWASVSSNVDRKHMMVQLLSKSIYSVQHTLDFPMQKVTHSAATLWRCNVPLFPWDPGQQLRFLKLVLSDNQFLSSEAFKGSATSISSYIQLALLFSLIFAPGQRTCFSSIEGAAVANILEQELMLMSSHYQVVPVTTSVDVDTTTSIVPQLATERALRQISLWSRQGFNPGDKEQQVLYMCWNFCSLLHSESYLQYRQWDPGIKCVLVEGSCCWPKKAIIVAGFLKNKQNALGRGWSYTLLDLYKPLLEGKQCFAGAVV